MHTVSQTSDDALAWLCCVPASYGSFRRHRNSNFNAEHYKVSVVVYILVAMHIRPHATRGAQERSWIILTSHIFPKIFDKKLFRKVFIVAHIQCFIAGKLKIANTPPGPPWNSWSNHELLYTKHESTPRYSIQYVYWYVFLN